MTCFAKVQSNNVFGNNMDIMKKSLILFTFLIFGHLSLFAQNSTTTQCTMTIDQISEAQPFNVDHPKQENTRDIASDIYTELTIVYDLVNQGNSSGLSSHLNAIQSSVDAAILLGMNYSMFQADLDYIETLN